MNNPPSVDSDKMVLAHAASTKKKSESVAGEPKRLTRVEEKNEGGGDVTGAVTEATKSDHSESDTLFSTLSGVPNDQGGEDSVPEPLSKKEKKRIAKELREKADVIESTPPRKH